MQRDRSDVVVVGGGLGGLVAATRAARRGARVTLFEKSELGGRALTQDKDGFRLNLGPHALYKGGPALRVFADLGVEVRGGVPAAAGIALRGGEAHPLPAGFFSLMATGLFGVGAKIEAGGILARIERMDSATLRSVSVRDWLTAIAHPEVRELVAAYLRLSTYCDDERQSVGDAIAQLKLAKAGVLYQDGGWRVLTEGLRAAAEKAGVTIVTNARVSTLAIDDLGVATGIELANGLHHGATAVIVVAGPRVAASLAPRSAALAKFAEAAIPVEVACLDVGLTSLPRPRVRFALGMDRPLYYSIHSASAALAPESGAVIHVARYLSAANPATPDDRAELESLLDRVQPGWREVVAVERFLPRMVASNAIVMAESGGLSGRPGPVVEDVLRLFVAGDWVGSEGMLLDASVASSALAADLATSMPRAQSAEPLGVHAL